MKFLFLIVSFFILTISGCGDTGTSNHEATWSTPKQVDINSYMKPATNARGDFLVSSRIESVAYAEIYNSKLELISQYELGQGTTPVKLSINDNGDAVYVYSNGTISNHTLSFVKYSPSQGWSIPQTVLHNLPRMPRADVALEQNGTVHLTWVQTDTANNSAIYYSRFSQFGWDFPVMISRAFPSVNPYLGGIAVGLNGEVMVLWSQFGWVANCYCYKSVYTPSSGWKEPEAFVKMSGIIKMSPFDKDGNVVMFINSSSGNVVGRLGINTAFDSKTINTGEYPASVTVSNNISGDAFITWGYWESASSGGIKGISYSHSTGWSEDILILDNPVDVVFSHEISGIDDSGNMYVSYATTENGGTVLKAMRFTPENGWGKPVAVSTGIIDIRGHTMVVSPLGNALLLWRAIQDDNNVMTQYMSVYQ